MDASIVILFVFAFVGLLLLGGGLAWTAGRLNQVEQAMRAIEEKLNQLARAEQLDEVTRIMRLLASESVNAHGVAKRAISPEVAALISFGGATITGNVDLGNVAGGPQQGNWQGGRQTGALDDAMRWGVPDPPALPPPPKDREE